MLRASGCGADLSAGEVRAAPPVVILLASCLRASLLALLFLLPSVVAFSPPRPDVKIVDDVTDQIFRIRYRQDLPSGTFISAEGPDVRVGGYFLHGSGRVLGVDYATQRSGDAGSSLFSDSCLGDDIAMSCGHCGYAGLTGDWRKPDALYTYGRCAAVSLESQLAPVVRADVRYVMEDLLEDWHATATIRYFRVTGSGQVHEVDAQTFLVVDCVEHRAVPVTGAAYAGVAVCEGKPTTYPIVVTGALHSAHYYCVYTAVYKHRLTNGEPERETGLCAPMP